MSGVKGRYPFKGDVTQASGAPWKMCQYLREVGLLEVIYDDLDDQQLSRDAH